MSEGQGQQGQDSQGGQQGTGTTILGGAGQNGQQGAGDGVQGQNGQGGQQGGQGQQGTQGGGKDWRAALPEELRGDQTLGKYKTPEEAHKAHVELARHMGVSPDKIVRLPEDPAAWDDATWAKIEASLPEERRRPDSPDGYKVELPKDSSFTGQDAELKSFLEGLHEAGLTQAQVDKVLELDAKSNAEAYSGVQKSREEAVAALKQAAGGEEAYNAMMANAERAAGYFRSELGNETYQTLFDGTGLGDMPDMVRLMAKVGELMGESDSRGGGRGAGGQSLEGARAEIASVETELRKLGENRKGSPEYERLNSRRLQLYETIQQHQQRSGERGR